MKFQIFSLIDGVYKSKKLSKKEKALVRFFARHHHYNDLLTHPHYAVEFAYRTYNDGNIAFVVVDNQLDATADLLSYHTRVNAVKFFNKRQLKNLSGGKFPNKEAALQGAINYYIDKYDGLCKRLGKIHLIPFNEQLSKGNEYDSRSALVRLLILLCGAGAMC